MKVYKRRNLHWLTPLAEPHFAQLGDVNEEPLSVMLEFVSGAAGRLFICGSKEQMTREFVEEPLSQGWRFARDYVHDARSPVYSRRWDEKGEYQISVKLFSESWCDGCEDIYAAKGAWKALSEEWASSTSDLPLMATPRKSGQALLWESFSEGKEYPALPDDVARRIRRVSFPNRIEDVNRGVNLAGCFCYDGRWSFAGFVTLDRFPISEPRETKVFEMFAPGWYRVAVTVPKDWPHVGLLPKADEYGSWIFPNLPGAKFETWAAEPELTLAQKNGWRFEVLEGFSFEKGCPLGPWAKRLIAIRDRLQRDAAVLHPFPVSTIKGFAAAAIRNILNHTVGAFHRDTYTREQFVSDDNLQQWKKDFTDRTGYFPNTAKILTPENRKEGGWMLPCEIADESKLSIYMPHWSAQVWALQRARVAEWALKCDPKVLVRIHGDAIYSTAELPLEDKEGRLGQPRRKQ